MAMAPSPWRPRRRAAEKAANEVKLPKRGTDDDDGGDDDATETTPAAARRRHDLLMWLYTAPGEEEAVLQGMNAGAPKRTIILGSTSADNSLEARWWQAAAPVEEAAASFCGVDVGATPASHGVVIVCMRPSIDFTPIYSHGFGETVHSATVEANADGDERMIKTLRPTNPPGAAPMPAAELFNQWTGGHFDEEIWASMGKWPTGSFHPLAARSRKPKKRTQQNILGKGSYFPLSAVRAAGGGTYAANVDDERNLAAVDQVGNQPTVLLHPAFIYPDGTLQVFAKAGVGTKVTLLTGTAKSLVHNLSIVGDSLDERAPFSRDAVIGSLFFFCGGTMDCVVNDPSMDPPWLQLTDNAHDERGRAVQGAFVKQTKAHAPVATGVGAHDGRKPFLASHPFGEQCHQLGWDAPVHANLMFGGVVFGKATFGMRKRAQIFVSYAWDDAEHMALVGGLKEEIERSTNLSAWMDRERMGGGCDLDEEMKRGVANADVLVCCLTDKYLERPNCLFELQAARESNTRVVPVLMAGYVRGHDGDVAEEEIEARGEKVWPPLASKDLEDVKAQLGGRMYIDMRTPEARADNFQTLIHSVDEIVRSERAERRLGMLRDAGKAAIAAGRMASAMREGGQNAHAAEVTA